jgi:hypothetical protein
VQFVRGWPVGDLDTLLQLLRSAGAALKEVAARRFFFCYPGSVGVFGFEHDSRDEPIIHLLELPRLMA